MKTLNAEQKEILEKFIIYFFEPTIKKRKSRRNELGYIKATLDLIFIQQFGFNLNRKDIKNAFENLGFNVAHKNDTYDPETKKFKPSINGEYNAAFYEINGSMEPPYTYFNIDTKVTLNLMRATKKLPETTNPDTANEVNLTLKKIRDFKNENKLA